MTRNCWDDQAGCCSDWSCRAEPDAPLSLHTAYSCMGPRCANFYRSGILPGTQRVAAQQPQLLTSFWSESSLQTLLTTKDCALGLLHAWTRKAE